MAESSLCSLSTLPDYLLEEVFCYLCPRDRSALASCCKRLALFLHSPYVWRNVTLRLCHGGGNQSQNSAGQVSSIPSQFVGRLSSHDRALTLRYTKHFWNVRLIISSAFLEEETFSELWELCWRGVVKSVEIRVDEFSVVHEGTSSVHSDAIYRNVFEVGSTSGAYPPGLGFFMQQLQPGTHLSLLFPVLLQNSQRPARERCHRHSVCCRFLRFPKPPALCSLLKKLVLPNSCNYNSQQNVAAVVSQCPCLEELHVDMDSLSARLLRELAGQGACPRREPLRRLVLRHVDIGQGTWERLPRLGTQVWQTLAQASPSLAVECYVRGDSLPPLDNVLWPEMPLVKVKVVCRSSSRENLLLLYALCRRQSATLRHLHLAVTQDDEGLHLSSRGKEALRDVVRACGRLQRLVLRVDCCSSTVVELATTAGRQWRSFEYSLEALVCCRDKVQCTSAQCSEFDCSCSGPLEYDRIEAATGFPYSAAPEEEALTVTPALWTLRTRTVSRVCSYSTVDVPQSQPE